MATVILLQNILDVTVEGLRCLPSHIIQSLWKKITQRDLLTLETFKLFSKALSKDSEATLDLLRYRQSINQPTSRLEAYTVPLTSRNFEFISSLTIDIVFPMSELVMLSSITNLGTLTIINSRGIDQTGVGDRLVRSWHLAAAEGAFPVLRLLSLQGFRDLTSRSLGFLNSFPALALYIVSGRSGFDAAAAQGLAHSLGWQAKYDTVILHLLEAACLKRISSDPKSLKINLDRHHHPYFSGLVDESKIHWVPRDQLGKLGQHNASNNPKVSTDGQTLEDRKPDIKAESKSDIRKATKNSSSTASIDDSMPPKSHQLIRKTGAVNYQVPRGLRDTVDIFTRIGELRKDTDLAHAGVPIGDQAMAGSVLLNSTPLVSLRLGWNSFNDPPQASLLCFIRIKWRNEELPKPKETAPATSLSSSKRNTPGVLRSGKKQKLENILGFSL